jgi:hypothetical protein
MKTGQRLESAYQPIWQPLMDSSKPAFASLIVQTYYTKGHNKVFVILHLVKKGGILVIKIHKINSLTFMLDKLIIGQETQ